MSQTGSGPPSGHTYSPDGRWWWDGRGWQPVRGAFQSATASPGTGARWLVAAVIVMVVASSLPLALGAAVFAARAIHNAAPGAAPPFRSYLMDASVTGIEAAARSHGLQCGTTVSIGFGASVHVCQRMARGEVMSVHLIGPDASRVAVVSADVLGLRPADGPAALALFQAVVGAAVAGADASADAEWLSAHFDQVGTSQTSVDGVTLRLTATGSNRSLSVYPAAS